jgi:WD repeat-containing protein 48
VCRDGDATAAGQSHNQGQGGINKLVVADDSLVWTATSSSSIRRWRIPARGSASAAASSPNLNSSYGYGGTNSARLSPSDAEDYYYERDGPRRSLAPSVLSYDDEGDGDDGETRSGIPYASLVRLTSPNDPFPVRGTGSGARDRDAEVATLYSAASVVSVPPLRSPMSHPSSPSHQYLASPIRSAPLPSARAAYFVRELAAEAQPLALAPDSAGLLGGERGLVRALVLNDRVHAVSVDTGGEVGVWDLVRGCCVGVYPREAVGLGVGVGGAGATEEWSPREALERVRERIEGEAVVGPWATVDTKAGVLAVHLNERSFESEIYADEVGYAGDRRFGDEAKRTCFHSYKIVDLTPHSEHRKMGPAESLPGLYPRRTACTARAARQHAQPRYDLVVSAPRPPPKCERLLRHVLAPPPALAHQAR